MHAPFTSTPCRAAPASADTIEPASKSQRAPTRHHQQHQSAIQPDVQRLARQPRVAVPPPRRRARRPPAMNQRGKAIDERSKGCCLAWADSTRFTMRASVVSAAARHDNVSAPRPLMVPANTSSLFVFSTGIDCP